MTRPRIGFLQLNSCSGCLFSVIGCAVFPDFLKAVDIRFFPLISDARSAEHLDVVFVEGGVSRDEERDTLRQLQTNGAKLVALGSCACLGGVMSYSSNVRVDPIGKFVDVHLALPGCPPSSHLIGSLLLSSITGTEFKLPEKNVCAECPLASKEQNFSKEVRYLQPSAPPKDCFLHKGVLCLGPITRAGCEARCIVGGAPCDGCNGSFDRDLPSAIANLFSTLKVSSAIREYRALPFRYQKPELRKPR